MTASRPDRKKDAARLAELHAEIEKNWPKLRAGPLPDAFRRLRELLVEAVAVAGRLDLAEEVERFGARLDEAGKLALVELPMLVARAESAVTLMYEPGRATGAYADAKDLFIDAIYLAESLGLADEAAKLSARLAEVKAVFRNQLS
jgi:hypothetical protein